MAERRLRPMSLGDIFDEGFDLYKKNFALFVLVTLVVTVPLDIVLGVVRALYWHGPGIVEALNSDDISNILGPVAGPLGAALLAACLVNAAPLAALSAATSARYLGQTVTLRQAYRVPLRRLPALLGTALLYGVIVTVSALPCGACFPWAAVSLIFTAHVFVLEGRTGFGAIKRTASLVSGHWWPVLFALLMLGLVYFILFVSIEMPLQFGLDLFLQSAPGGHGLMLPGDALHTSSIRRQVVGSLSSGLTELLILPFLWSVMTVLYYDLKVRKEAYDIDLLVMDLGYPVADSSRIMIPPVALTPPVAAQGKIRGRT